jgi:peptide/nickel transport system substrate-binding protein
MHPEELVTNDLLRRARSLKCWSQEELAKQVGTSFEMVSRWERGVTLPSPYYRERLCSILGQSAEDLGLIVARTGPFVPSSPGLIVLASSHRDAEKAITSRVKTVLQDLGFTLWSSRQLGRHGGGSAQTALREAVRVAQAVLVIVSPDARSSRHVRDALEMASRYQRPICGMWIEGESWQECFPKKSSNQVAMIDAREKEEVILLKEIATELERMGSNSQESSLILPPHAEEQQEASKAHQMQEELLPVKSARSRFLPLGFRGIGQQRRASPLTKGLFLGLSVLVVAAGILGNLSLFNYFSRGQGLHRIVPAHGGTWIADVIHDPGPLIPHIAAPPVDNLLYLPLFYQDEQAVVHPGAAVEIPTLQNGGISADAKTWTFHMRPHLVWSDGEPYDARDVDFTWRLWLNPDFGAFTTIGYDLISSADVSADSLTIIFHLKRAYVAFYQLWVNGFSAPLPAHYYRDMVPDQIATGHPRVVSGPFVVEESVVGDHYILVRNPRYYRASEGMPYLDKLVLRIVDQDEVVKDLQAGTINSVRLLDFTKLPLYQRQSNYVLYKTPISSGFEAMYFNFHNSVLNHLEVRQAMAMAIDHQAIINAVPGQLASPLCTDHNTAFHPGYEPAAPCSVFDPAAANKLLSDNGWVKGPDGVRARGGERLEFQYSTAVTYFLWRLDTEPIIQRNLQTIGIKLDLQNYASDVFWSEIVPAGEASPPSGAVAGRYDIAEGMDGGEVDADDAMLLDCNLFTPRGANYGFYCDPALDDLLHQEQTAVDPGVRQQIFMQIHRYNLTKFPFIVLYGMQNSLAMVRKGTHNYQQNPSEQNFSNSWEWWCENGKC